MKMKLWNGRLVLQDIGGARNASHTEDEMNSKAAPAASFTAEHDARDGSRTKDRPGDMEQYAGLEFVPTVALYVRRGDKIGREMELVPFSAYVNASEQLMTRLGHMPGQPKHMFLVRSENACGSA